MKCNKNPLISILVPCYKSTEFIRRTIDSVLAQTYPNWELVCIDDCSPDNTFDVLCDIAKSDSRIHVFRADKNNGKAAPTLNLCVNKAQGDFIALLGHDDELSPDYLEKFVARYLETGADIIIPDAVFFFEDAPEKNWTMAGIVEKFGKDNNIVDRSVILSGREAVILSLNWRIHAWAIFSASIVKKHMFCEYGMNGDEYSTREFFLDANKVAFSDGKYLYHQVETSITKKMSPKRFDTWNCDWRIENLLKENKFPKKIIRKFNRKRFNAYASQVRMYHKNYETFTNEEKQLVEKHLNLSLQHLSIYKVWYDYIFRKEKYGYKRVLVFLNFIKITYTHKGNK